MNMYNEPKLFALKWMNESHVLDVAHIERQCFDIPWLPSDFRLALRGTCKGKIALLQGKIVGYVLWDTRKRSLHIVNMAVHPDQQGRGFAKYMLRHLQNKLRATSQNYRWINTMCREDNTAAIQLFTGMGFVALGVERSPYSDVTTDGIVLQWERENVAVTTQRECCGK